MPSALQGSISPDVLQNVLRPIIVMLYLLAIIPTIFRIAYRAWVKQLWWDDAWAAFSMVNAALLLGVFFKSSLNINGHYDESYLNFIYITTLVTLTLSLWGARLSVAVTIVRCIATGRIKVAARIVAFIFGFFCIGLLIQKIMICGPPSSVKFLCSNPKFTGYSELVTSIMADLYLLSAPAILLWRMNLRQRHHRLLQTIFASEVVVLAVSIVRSVYVARQDYLMQAVTSHFEISVSLLVCNLLFMVTYIYRVFHRGDESRSEHITTAPTRHTDPHPSQNSNVMSSLGPLSSVYISYSSSSGGEAESKCAEDTLPSVQIMSDPGPTTCRDKRKGCNYFTSI